MEAAKAARASTSAAAAAIARAPPPANRPHVYPIAIPVATVDRVRARVVGEDPRRRAPIVRDSADEMGDDALGGGADDEAGRVPRRRNDAAMVASIGSASVSTAHAGGEGGRGGSSARAAEVGVADLATSSKLSADARGFVPGGKKAP